MQRVLEIAQLMVYSIIGAVFLWLGIHGSTVLTKISQDLDQGRVVHEQMLIDHQQQLKGHER